MSHPTSTGIHNIVCTIHIKVDSDKHPLPAQYIRAPRLVPTSIHILYSIPVYINAVSTGKDRPVSSHCLQPSTSHPHNQPTLTLTPIMASTNSSIQNEPTPNPFDPDALIILSIPCIPCLEQQLGSWHMDSAFWPIRCHHYQANERQYLANYAVWVNPFTFPSHHANILIS